MHTLTNFSNPFVALGVEARELSYSKAIANILFRNEAYLDALSSRLKLSQPLRFTKGEIHTEYPFGPDQRLDVFAVDDSDRKVIVETKVCAPLDLGQQSKYVATASSRWPGGDCFFIAYKFGPALLRENVPQFHLVTSKETLEDLPPGEHLGLRPMLEMFSSMEDRIQDNPVAPLRKEQPLDHAIISLFSEPLYRRLFQSFCDQVANKLVGTPIVGSFGVTARGGKIAQFYDQGWLSQKTGTQIHFELKDNDRVSLHVETFPYPSTKPAHLGAKARLIEAIRAALSEVDIPGLRPVPPRRGWESSSSTTVASVSIDFQDLGGCAACFATIYNACHPILSKLFQSQANPIS